MAKGWNNLYLQAFRSGTTPAAEAGLEAAENLRFTKFYPGGKAGACSFFVPRQVGRWWSVKENQRLVVRNGMDTAWEGKITAIEADLQAEAQGYKVTATGYWGDVLGRQELRKPWADPRIDEDTWQEPTSASGASDISLLGKCSLDRLNRLRWNPRSTRDASGNENGWTTNQFHRVIYTAPTGQTIKKVSFNFDLQKGTQNWTLGLWNVTSGASVWSVNASGTGSQALTLATPAASVYFYLLSGADQVPPSDGTVYGEVSSVVVFTETGNINAYEVALDIAGYLSELSTDVSLIGALTYSLASGFYADPFETYADILTRAAAFGDGSQNPWAAYVDYAARTGDGKPRLALAAQPALTDYDYVLSLDEHPLNRGAKFDRNVEDIANYIIVGYTDSRNRLIWTTPDDDAALKDTDSIAKYGRRDRVLSVNAASLGYAKEYGKRYLAQYKDLNWRASQGLHVTGAIRHKRGQLIPASQIEPGKRLLVQNYLSEINADAPILMISGVDYEDRTETAMLSFGMSTSLDVLLARWAAGMETKSANLRKR
jgi:hypothetical protein